MLTPDVIAAFFTGATAILGSAYAMRRVRRAERRDCAERIRELDAAHARGLEQGLTLSLRRATDV